MPGYRVTGGMGEVKHTLHTLPLAQGRLESVLSMMQLEQDVLLVAVCKLTVKATSMQAFSRRGVRCSACG